MHDSCDPTEIGLEPDDLEPMRALAHEMVDTMFEHIATTAERPIWRPVPASVDAVLDEPVPVEPVDLEKSWHIFRDHVLPWGAGNTHPRFWGWVKGSGSVAGMLADLLAAGMNANMVGFDQAPARIERQVVRWFTELFGMPSGTSGIVTSGGSMANIIGIHVARDARLGGDVRSDGLRGRERRATIHASTAVHACVLEAVEMLGLGSEALRTAPTGADHAVDVGALEDAIRRDREDGGEPFCVVANAGSVDTGAMDDLDALADLCARERLWLHVDGAFGALAVLSDELRDRVRGIERADSIAFDLHKWLHVPYGAGCVLVRDGDAHRAAYESHPAYYQPIDGGIQKAPVDFNALGPEMSRGFRALKVWMTLRTYGVDRLTRLIEQNVRQAEELGRLVEASEHLELLAPVTLNVVCLRHRVEGATAAEVDAFNRELLVRCQETALAIPSSTVVDGAFALRAAITNHRTRRADLTGFVEGLERLGREMR